MNIEIKKVKTTQTHKQAQISIDNSEQLITNKVLQNFTLNKAKLFKI